MRRMAAMGEDAGGVTMPSNKATLLPAVEVVPIEEAMALMPQPQEP